MATMRDASPRDAQLMHARPLHRSWGWLLFLGIVQIIGGLVAFAIPVAATLAATIVFAAVLLVTGIFQLAHAFSVRRWTGVLYQALGGLLYLAAGVLLVIYPLTGALTLTIVIATLLIIEGVVRTVLAVRVGAQEGRGWFLAGGIASAAVGVLLLIGWPFTGLWAIGILLGVNLVFSGVANCSLAVACRSWASHGPEHGALAH